MKVRTGRRGDHRKTERQKKSSEELGRREEEQTVGIVRLRGIAKGCQGR